MAGENVKISDIRDKDMVRAQTTQPCGKVLCQQILNECLCSAEGVCICLCDSNLNCFSPHISMLSMLQPVNIFNSNKQVCLCAEIHKHTLLLGLNM